MMFEIFDSNSENIVISGSVLWDGPKYEIPYFRYMDCMILQLFLINQFYRKITGYHYLLILKDVS